MIRTMPSIEQKAALFVVRLFADKLPAHFKYHNLEHTHRVVRAVRRIGRAEGLGALELEMLELAAWFHDTGFIEGRADHEIRSAAMARNFLEKADYPEYQIRQIESCILATCCPHYPEGYLEEIICDADLFHLASPDYQSISNNLRTEWAALGQSYSDDEWFLLNKKFLNQHFYFTKYGQKYLEPVKWMNMEKYLAKAS